MSGHGQHDTCETCGALLSVSDWPWCPHGRYGGTNVVDTLPGGPRFIENLGDQPVWVETQSQLTREAKTRGLINVVRHMPNPKNGTSFTSRWV